MKLEFITQYWWGGHSMDHHWKVTDNGKIHHLVVSYDWEEKPYRVSLYYDDLKISAYPHN
jgi:hypothetical protein